MENRIEPSKITKPIQLLAAWLAGLLAIDSCFLIAASKMPVDSWAAQALTVAAIANVPIFLVAVFLLQTKFRPELQEDLYYSSYISQKTNAPVQVTKEDAIVLAIQQRLERLESLGSPNIGAISTDKEFINLSHLKIGINKHLPDKNILAKQLGKHGVISFATFGSAEMPSERTVAISHGLTGDLKTEVLLLASELGFKRFNYIEGFEEIDEDVLFGSYGKGEYELIPKET